MQISSSFATVPFSDIDDNDQFRITTDVDKDMGALETSISEVGLLSPPALRRTDGGKLQVVAGFRRLTAVKQLGAHWVLCRVIPEDTDIIDCFRLAIADNIANRVLNPVEQATAVSKLYSLLKDPGAVCDMLSRLGLPLNPSVMKKLQCIYGLPKKALDGIAGGWIGLTVGVELARLARDDAVAIAEIFQALRPGANKQREILTLSREIAARENISISRLLCKEPGIVEILENEGFDRGLKTARVLAWLKIRRFPVISSAHERYSMLEKELGLGSHARLTPPENFEGSVFSLELKFSKTEHLADHAQLLARLAESRAMEEILSIGERIDRSSGPHPGD